MAGEGRVLVRADGDDDVVVAVSSALVTAGWIVEHAGRSTPVSEGPRLDGIVFVPGLLDTVAGLDVDPAAELVELVESLGRRLRSGGDGGARIVAVGSRDWLGWAGRPAVAAQAAGLVAAVRSLALERGRAGLTVNCVLALPLDAHRRRHRGAVPGTHLHEPVALTPEPVTSADIAATVEFFLDPRSNYITGQALHCCGGASLLSSLSV
ncbi:MULTISPECIES: SDR family oxidoreductase [Nocardioides]|uniref:SDR family oxidoreductase n=1 Tax=Nocardioides vastitatis TaxID=2568655 RepID=A0ABW0ZF25_9ACTN|nr:SDR family oxidoreductase [Nocardioides sp.]THI96854.1 SDR family oxidoreductase [Nocardioides sp.]